jgi:two-component system, response regulator
LSSRGVLLVEDNEDDIELTLRAFARNNISNQVTVAHDGAQALELLLGESARSSTGLPMLILLDLHLPKVDGLDVLARVRADERTRRVPIVVLTSSYESEEIQRAYGLGANSYIIKPVDWDQLVETTRQIGLYWLVVNEPSRG